MSYQYSLINLGFDKKEKKDKLHRWPVSGGPDCLWVGAQSLRQCLCRTEDAK